MKVLSIRQPWAWLICNGIKDLENRTWTTRYRGTLLIHAGQQFEDEAVYPILNNLSDEERKQFPMRASLFPRCGLVGIAKLADVTSDSESKWYVPGSYAWCFSKALSFDLIPLRGQLGLFDVPADIVARVRIECERKRVVA